jgi:hypothetical protein
VRKQKGATSRRLAIALRPSSSSNTGKSISIWREQDPAASMCGAGPAAACRHAPGTAACGTSGGAGWDLSASVLVADRMQPSNDTNY